MAPIELVRVAVIESKASSGLTKSKIIQQIASFALLKGDEATPDAQIDNRWRFGTWSN